MNEKEEKLYIQGETEALKKIITHCQTKLQAFGVELSSDEKFSHERIEVIGLLRMLCDDIGDNEWEDDLHLVDIIQKHLIMDYPMQAEDETDGDFIKRVKEFHGINQKNGG